MIYKLLKDVDAFHLKAGDVFEWRKEGYVHEYMDDVWIGLPQPVVEDNPEYFKLDSRKNKQTDLAVDILDSLAQFNKHLDYIFKKYKL